jgi:hypothetical protein
MRFSSDSNQHAKRDLVGFDCCTPVEDVGIDKFWEEKKIDFLVC